MELFRNLFSRYLKPVKTPAKTPVKTPEPTESEKPMGTPADTLVTKYPDRVSQILGPVYDYLKPMVPYSQVPQDLYMAVFYPKARKWPPNTEFSAGVQKVNPGIVRVSDYVEKVERISTKNRPVLSAAEDAALASTAAKLGVAKDSLYKLINFESGWNPQATNRYTGARGLIQFMPKTAKGMGFAAMAGILPLLLVAGIVYFIMKKQGYL